MTKQPLKDYVCFVDGSFHSQERLRDKPPNIPHKKVVWYAVGTDRAGQEPEWTFDGDTAHRTVPPPPPPYAPHIVSKLEVLLRMTDQEVLATQTKLSELESGAPKLHALYLNAIEFDHNNEEFFPSLMGIYTELFGEERATELLEATR